MSVLQCSSHISYLYASEHPSRRGNHMLRIELGAQARAVGLTCTGDGVITDGEYDYLRVMKKTLVTPKGDLMDLDEVDHLEYRDTDHEITLVMKNGEDRMIRGDGFDALMERYTDADPSQTPPKTPPKKKAGRVGSSRKKSSSAGKPKVTEEDPVAVPEHGEGISAEPPIILREMPKSLSALKDAFPILFPDYEDQLFYDELLEREMVDMTMLDRPNEGTVPLDDAVLAIYHESVERRLMARGFVGKGFPSRSIMDEALVSFFHDNPRNAFREWIESHEWDGKPRVRRWFIELFGATAPPLVNQRDEEAYLGDVSEAWFVGGVRRAYMETKHEIVPVLIGGQGIGKGLGLKYTAGRDNWYKDTAADISDPIKFLDSVKGSVIVELSESTQINGGDNNRLKSFISEMSDQYRKPYARYPGRYPRRFIMAATSNEDNIFTDETGSRRYFPMYCDPAKATRPIPTKARSTRYQYEVEQVWAEALHMYREGHDWYLEEEAMRRANIVQEYGSEENAGVNAIAHYLDDPINGFADLGAKVCRDQIMLEVFGVNPTAASKDQEEAFKAWCNSNNGWYKMAKPYRIGGAVRRGYERREFVDDTIPRTRRLLLVDGYDEDDEAKDYTRILRRLSKDMGLVVGSELDPERMSLTLNDIEALMELGYVCDHGRSASDHRYIVHVLP